MPWPAGVVESSLLNGVLTVTYFWDPRICGYATKSLVYLKAAWGKYTPAYVTGLPEGARWVHWDPAKR